MRSHSRRALFRAALACAVTVCLFSAGCSTGNTTPPDIAATQATATPAPRVSPTAEAVEPSPAGANANAAATPKPGESPDLTGSGDASEEEFEGTAATVEKERPGAEPSVLVAVRTARHANFERVVFEFEGKTPPGYHVEYVDRPVRQCGSGEEVRLAGDAWLEVRFRPARAHTEAGEATVKERSLRLNYANLKELKSTCDFEADVEWVLGLAAPNRYRVLELSNPTRIVLDVKTRQKK